MWGLELRLGITQSRARPQFPDTLRTMGVQHRKVMQEF